jgi:midasin
MSQLEVGQLGVLSFGEKVKMLHPFDRPFTDDAGSEIISQFTFDQKQTQMADFLKYSTQMMEIYRSFSSFRQNIEEVQLTFIISDGRLLEREEIVKLVREANAKRQLIVFILIDSQNSQDSVLELKTITYPNNKLTIQNYIDQFPFPYYIILRNIQTLPEILADALRQWFELMQTIQE